MNGLTLLNPSSLKLKAMENNFVYDTKIVSAFPGTGKSYYVNQEAYCGSFSSIDSDSSKFDKAFFPDNYIQHITENIGKKHIIFVSSHASVRHALEGGMFNFYLVYPDRSLKEEYLDRYRKRGSSENFINLISQHWDTWIDEMEAQQWCTKIVLKSGEYVSNYF